MKTLYLASPYYDNEFASGANKRFDSIGKRFASRLGSAFKTIVCQGNKPHWVEEGNNIYLPAFSSNIGKLRTWLHFNYVLLRVEAGHVVTDFIPAPFAGLRKHRHAQLIHDLRDFTEFKRDQLPLVATLILRRQLRRSDRVITVSDFSKDCVVQYCGLPADRVIKSYNGIESVYRTQGEDIERDIDFLYVATFEARKNHQRLIEALATIDEKLRVSFVGRDHGLRPSIEALATTTAQKNGMEFTFIDQIDEQGLVDIYHRTKVYVCPSLLEGFGMPLVEALAANCNVACSDIPVFREVCQEHAVYFDPSSPTDIAKSLRASVVTPTPSIPPLYLDRFSWDTIAEDLLADLGYPY